MGSASLGVKCRVCGDRRVKCRLCAVNMPAIQPPEIPYKKLLVPQPLEQSLRPQHARCVVTLAIGEEAEACLAASEPFMRAYAARLNADFYVLRSGGHPAWPMSAKFGLYRLLDAYDAVLYMDADVLPRQGCVDIFAHSGTADWAACDERAYHQLTAGGRRLLASRKPPFYFNCGVQVARKRAQRWLLPPREPMPAHHCGEQDYVNDRVREAWLSGELDIRCLDRRCNWQNWHDPGFAEAPPDAVLHWSAMGVRRANRAVDMAHVARLYARS